MLNSQTHKHTHITITSKPIHITTETAELLVSTTEASLQASVSYTSLLQMPMSNCTNERAPVRNPPIL